MPNASTRIDIDTYAVIGNPIGHSLSPRIHTAFAEQTGQALHYEAILGPRDAFRETVLDFRDKGGCGMNVTVPFKLEAHALADRLSERAHAAGAVNTLQFLDGIIFGDNTDGAGLVRDLTHNLGCALGGAQVLLLGAGGAARGVLLPLLQQQPASLTLANRTVSKAEALSEAFQAHASDTFLRACGFSELDDQRFDVVINATAASLSDDAPPLPLGIYTKHALAYDMMYGKGSTPFLEAARNDGAARTADGLGMLVEQAAESFALWRGVRPDTTPVLTALRQQAGHG